MVPEKTHRGYSIFINFIGFASLLAVLFAATPAASAERLAVSAPLANIRSGPEILKLQGSTGVPTAVSYA